MTQTKEVQEVQAVYVNRVQAKVKLAKAREIWDDFHRASQSLRVAYRYFRDRTLKQYLDEGNIALNDYLPSEANIKQEGWEPELFDPLTREKIRKDLSKLSGQRIKGEVRPRQSNDHLSIAVATILEELLDLVNDRNDEDEKLLFELFACKTEGTVVGYEGFKRFKRKIKDDVELDLDTGEVTKFKERTVYEYNDVYGCLVSLLDFYPGNIFEREIQEQPYLVWRQTVTWDQFKRQFSEYPDAELVSPRGQIAEVFTEIPFFGISEDIRDDEVEVLRYYNKRQDEYHVLANGILLTRVDNPLPFDHKQYPFWKAISEPFSDKFFYGKSDPDLYLSLQYINNQLLNMMLAQGFLAIYKPIITESEDDLAEGYLMPGRVAKVENVDKFRELQISEPSSFYLRMVQLVQGRLESLSAAEITTATGTERTAREVTIARQTALELISTFLRFMETGIKHKYRLRLANMLQFYAKKIDLDAKGKPTYRSFKIDAGKLLQGGEGTKVIRFTDKQDLPLYSHDLALEKQVLIAVPGQEANLFEINVDYLRRFEFTLKIIPNSSVRESDALAKSMDLEFYDRTLNNPLFDPVESAKVLALAYGKDPMRVLAKNRPGQAGQPPAGLPGAGGEQSRGVTTPLVEQMSRGSEPSRFQSTGPSLSDLAREMQVP